MSAPRIAFDAYGSERGPEAEVHAAVEVAGEDLRVLLVGRSEELERLVADAGGSEAMAAGFLELVDARERIEMGDSPGSAVRRKPDASMPVGFDLVKAGRADAVVSAGNSGAMMACALFRFGRLKGVDRPAIATKMPRPGGDCILVDAGANVDCQPNQLFEFAVMGATYCRLELGHARPRVAVLSNGSEPGKGTVLTREADALIRRADSEDFAYVGYAEGGDLFRDFTDVMVTDGFTGNVLLKASESLAERFAPYLEGNEEGMELRSRCDPQSHGGAPLLGVRGLAIICHGSSTALALANGLRLAGTFVRKGLTEALRDAIARHQAPRAEA